MTDPEIMQVDISNAALLWCGMKDRETFLDDIKYFENNWRALNGMKSIVQAFARHRMLGRAEGAAQERAEIVAWLRENDFDEYSHAAAVLATKIEYR